MYILFILVACLTVYLSIKLSYYADLMSKGGKSKALIGGILLAGITSLPEFITCFSAVLLKNPYLAIGDVLGSNFFNIIMISFFDIVFIKKYLFNKSSKSHNLVYIILIINYVFVFLSLKGLTNFSIFNIGLPSITIFITYLYYLKNISKKKNDDTVIETNSKTTNYKFALVAVFMIIMSFILTLIANKISLLNPRFSSSLVGAILLGITTSLPEVITFVSLIKFNSYDLALSNILGSNLFNLFVLALTDIILRNNSIYNYSERSSIYLIIFSFVVTLIGLYQNGRKKKKTNKFYAIPSIISLVLYICFWIIN